MSLTRSGKQEYTHYTSFGSVSPHCRGLARRSALAKSRSASLGDKSRKLGK